MARHRKDIASREFYEADINLFFFFFINFRPVITLKACSTAFNVTLMRIQIRGGEGDGGQREKNQMMLNARI